MITKRYIPLTIVILIASVLISGCKDNLTRGEAKEKLQECLNNNCKEIPYLDTCTYAVRKSFITDYGSDGYFCPAILSTPLSNEERNFAQYLLDKGYANIFKEQTYKGCAYWTVNTIQLTEKGKQYLINETPNHFVVWTAIFAVGEVTGIMEHKELNTSTVEYKLERTERSPLGEFWPVNCNDTSKTYKATFTKYDDGWRL